MFREKTNFFVLGEYNSPMKYFGTDGVRLIFSEKLISLSFKIGFSLGRNYDSILVAHDTRESGVILARAFVGGAIKGGATVRYGGVLSTPCLATAVREGFFKVGAMITASHNPSEYNGIKLFDGEGFKLTEKELLRIEREIDEIPFDGLSLLPPLLSTPKEIYLEKLQNLPKPQKELTILCDCSNGATSEIAPKAFEGIGVQTHFIGLHGIINKDVGVFHLENALKTKKEKGCDLAFVFDGDGDRILAIDEDDEIIDGDVILFILAKWLKSQNKLASSTVVGTNFSSLALDKSLEKENITLLRTEVGDKFISETLRRELLTLGGESSGHIIYNSTTGDGVKTAILLSFLASLSPLAERKKGFLKTFRQEFTFQRKEDLFQTLSKKVELIEKEKDKNGRILLRISGTEPVIRLLIEHKERSIFESWKTMFDI